LRERKEASWKSGQDIFSFENQAAHLLYLTNQTLTF
jgi:hypothetical protein